MLVLAACSFGEAEASEQSQLASGAPLPTGCADRDATASFVAGGRAWALDPATGQAQCLFRVQHPGSFAWGPRGDRALLANLEVKGLGNAPTRPPGRVDPSASSWGRPIGKSIVVGTSELGDTLHRLMRLDQIPANEVDDLLDELVVSV